MAWERFFDRVAGHLNRNGVTSFAVPFTWAKSTGRPSACTHPLRVKKGRQLCRKSGPGYSAAAPAPGGGGGPAAVAWDLVTARRYMKPRAISNRPWTMNQMPARTARAVTDFVGTA